jgi:hypothetical protein
MATAEERAALAADTDFQRQQAAIQRALAQFQAGQTATASGRRLDLSNAYRSLGYDENLQDFNRTDKTMGFGQATNAARQNFAGRGMLKSSGYTGAAGNILRNFKNQADNLRTGQQTFETGQTSDLQAFQADQADALDFARQAALRRKQDALRAGLF